MLDVIDLVLGLMDLAGSSAFNSARNDARRGLAKRCSGKWPTSQATVLGGRIEKHPGRCLLSAPYWFYADGERYGGQYKREFATDSAARDKLQWLLASPPMVRYKPGDPDTSILDDD